MAALPFCVCTAGRCRRNTYKMNFCGVKIHFLLSVEKMKCKLQKNMLQFVQNDAEGAENRKFLFKVWKI